MLHMAEFRDEQHFMVSIQKTFQYCSYYPRSFTTFILHLNVNILLLKSLRPYLST